MEFIDKIGEMLLRIKAVGFILVICIIAPFILYKGVLLIRDLIGLLFGRIPGHKYESDVQSIKTLLSLNPHADREARARMFVERGIYFIKGPFRNPVNFTAEELERLPTNAELGNARLGK